MHTGWNFYKDPAYKQYAGSMHEYSNSKKSLGNSDYYKHTFNEKERLASIERNKWLLASAKTKFKVNDIVLLDNRHVVVIVAVQPKGYESVPRSYSVIGSRILNPIIRDENIYHYRHLGKNYNNKNRGMLGGIDGQTTENHFSVIKDK